jgi:hypothetical protein
MKTKIPPLAALFFFWALVVSACSAASRLPDATISTPEAVNQRAGERSGLVYINNDTYLASPGALLGSVLVLREGFPENEAQFELIGFRDFNHVSSDPKYELTVQSLLVNRSLAAEVGFLSFFKSQLSTTNLLSMTVRDEIIQRHVDDEKWSTAYEKWKQNPSNRALLADTNITKILVVRGFIMKSLTCRNYTLIKGNATGSYGVSLGGNMYSSSDENRMVYLWGLDYGVMYSSSGHQNFLGSDGVKELCYPRDPTQSESVQIEKAMNGRTIGK